MGVCVYVCVCACAPCINGVCGCAGCVGVRGVWVPDAGGTACLRSRDLNRMCSHSVEIDSGCSGAFFFVHKTGKGVAQEGNHRLEFRV